MESECQAGWPCWPCGPVGYWAAGGWSELGKPCCLGRRDVGRSCVLELWSWRSWKTTIALQSSSNSPLKQEVAIQTAAPTTIGFGYGAGDPTIPINPSDFYGTVSAFSYLPES